MPQRRHRRRQDRAQPARGKQPAGRIFLIAGLRKHRIGNGAERDRRGHAGSGRSTSRNEAAVTARPAPVALRPNAASEKSIKNLPAFEYCKNAP